MRLALPRTTADRSSAVRHPSRNTVRSAPWVNGRLVPSLRVRWTTAMPPGRHHEQGPGGPGQDWLTFVGARACNAISEVVHQGASREDGDRARRPARLDARWKARYLLLFHEGWPRCRRRAPRYTDVSAPQCRFAGSGTSARRFRRTREIIDVRSVARKCATGGSRRGHPRRSRERERLKKLAG